MTLKMKNTGKLEVSASADLGELVDFLSTYAAFLLSSGATALRVEKNVGRIAAHYQKELILTVMPRHIELMLREGSTQAFRLVGWKRGINFFAITKLSRLSWRVIEEGLNVCQAKALMEEVKARKRLPIPMVTVMAGLANASFCRLFEGDYWAMLFVFLATVCGFYTRHKLVNSLGIDMRIGTLIVACLSAIISCGSYIYHLGTTPETALATSVLYLVPGVPYINAFSDYISGHHICAQSWMISALETTVCLGTGWVLCHYLLNI